MFEGELESLKAIRNTNTLSVPRPQRVLPHPSGQGAVLVVEYVDMRGLHKYQSQLGEQLARWTRGIRVIYNIRSHVVYVMYGYILFY